MSIWDKFFNRGSKESASIAKNRLKIIIARGENSNPILTVIEDEVIEAIKKYVKINPDNIESNVEDDDLDILRVNAGLENEDDGENLSLLEMIFKKKGKSASVAKERLRIIIPKDVGTPDFHKKLEKDVEDIVRMHVSHSPDKIDIIMDIDDEGNETLEININLPEEINNI